MDFSVVGQNIPRLEGKEKVTGQAKYIDDISFPNMLHGKLLRSPYPHARIVAIDTAAAKALSGVKAIITAEDLPDRRHGPFVQDAPLLARGKVNYIGEPVAAVAAVSLEAAERALSLIKVNYERLPEVLDPVKAMESGAPIIHENLDAYPAVFPIQRHGNICSLTTIEDGDIEQGFKAADFVFEDTFTTPMVHQCHLETNGAIAVVDAQGKATVWASTQSIHLNQIRIAETLDIPMSKIRVIQTRVGGGFGAKVELTVQPYCVAMARLSKRPVKMILTREEELVATRPRHASVVTVKTGVKKDGTLVARHIKLIYDTGAYADDGPGIVGNGALMASGPYRVPNYKIEGYSVYTNKVATGAYRGFGNPQAAWACESQLDIIARELGIDPLEIRMRNALDPGDKTVGGQNLFSVGIKECLKAVKEGMDWESPKSKNRGRGVACVHQLSAVMSSAAYVRINQDGTAHVAVGAADIGQGSDTTLAQIAAEELGMDIEDVAIVTQDTDATPYNWATTATRLTYMAGNAVRRAAADAKQQLINLAAEALGLPADQLSVQDKAVVSVDEPQKKISYEELGVISHWVKGGQIIGKNSWLFDEQPFGKEVKMTGFPFRVMGAYNYGVHAVEVEVDQETGLVRVVNALTAHDVGKAINPLAVEGQSQGGFAQGLGYALFEDLKVKDGKIISNNLLNFKIPTAVDVPAIKSLIVESDEKTGPFGAKGIGEPPLVPGAPAIANAVQDAVGVRIKDLPLTPERVLAAINSKT